MMALTNSRQVRLAERAYRLLLLAYPAEFRRAYEHEMTQTFRHACRATLSQEGNAGLTRLWGLTLYDLVRTSVQEHGQALFLRLLRLVSRPVLFLSPTGLEAVLLTSPLHLQIAQQTDIGIKRALNEDNLLTVLPEDPQILENKGALFVVADGMGGHELGERASELAVNTVRETYYQAEPVDVSVALIQAVERANTLIYEANKALPDFPAVNKGMGTTCIAAVLQEKILTVANVGDSRAYLVHAGTIRQISRDHSLVAEMVRNGEITASEARVHEQRNVISRAVGIAADIEVDVFIEAVEDGDALILCTDGLCGQVYDHEILQIVETYEPQESVRQLIAQANAAGGPDNITAIVVRVD